MANKEWIEWQKKVIREEHVMPELLDEKIKNAKRDHLLLGYVKDSSKRKFDPIRY
ncbi:hypothetical protein [Alkalihalobacillus deserti]|uniref:hypothetical protein n=1 Tax=Alkalihalobacillus deserti TaxID=2879466 RepID=UPI001D15B04A|nr:hypothetical protein [Alkalihalobacillus deserti]